MGAREYRIRPCALGDAHGVVELFRRCFSAPFDLETWRWKYESGPWARPELGVVAELRSGQIVGHLGAMVQPLNRLGRTSLVAQGADGMVDAPYRHRGVLDELFSAWIAGVAASGIGAGYLLPNENSVRAADRRLTLVAIMEKYYLPLGGAHHARLAERVRAAPERVQLPFEFRADDELDPRYEVVWRSAGERESLSIAKDGAYLHWKYAAAPERHRLFTICFGAERIAVAVCRDRPPRAQVLDLIARDKNAHAARALLLGIADYYRGSEIEELRFVGHDPWFFAEVFADFERRPDFWGQFYVRAVRRDDAFVYENPLNWTIVAGDADS
jgi:GNAT acetyltransferase-like protein